MRALHLLYEVENFQDLRGANTKLLLIHIIGNYIRHCILPTWRV